MPITVDWPNGEGSPRTMPVQPRRPFDSKDLLWSMRRFVKTPEVMAGILTVGVIGLLTDQLIRYAHRRYFRYL